MVFHQFTAKFNTFLISKHDGQQFNKVLVQNTVITFSIGIKDFLSWWVQMHGFLFFFFLKGGTTFVSSCLLP